jgi:DNA polymerase I-like protein with 3'-5' exonuclease and polymerase domains
LLVFPFFSKQAVNTVIQGTAADVVKRAMIKVDDALRNTPTRLLLQIHDVSDRINQISVVIKKILNIFGFFRN